MRSALSTHDAFWQQSLVESVRQVLDGFEQTTTFVVACSGGRDSMVVLALLQHWCPTRVRAIYINHQLHRQAIHWGQQVQRWCEHHQVPCQQMAVQVQGANLEQAAREARYAAFDQAIQAHEVLVLGHHRQDQAETVLMRLCAGGSLQGVAAMRAHSSRGHYRLWRPLLRWSRADIDQAVAYLDLAIVDDPANQQLQYDRVWLRQQLWPVLHARWPHAEQGLSRFAHNMQDVQSILQEVITQDWQDCRVDATLSMVAMAGLSVARRRQLLTWWLQGDEPYAPPQARIDTLLGWLSPNLRRADAVPQVDWQCWRVYGYREHYHRVALPLPVAQAKPQVMQATQIWSLACGQFQIEHQQSHAQQLPIGQTIHLRGRIDGERLQMSGKTQHSPLKKLLQSWQILPWQRQSITVWCVGDVILGVFCPNGFYPSQMADSYLMGWQIAPYPSIRRTSVPDSTAD